MSELASRSYCSYTNRDEIEYDEAKRQLFLAERGLDFSDAVIVLSGTVVTTRDDRQDYGEERFQTHGLLNDEVLMIVWTPRNGRRRIISMRRCHAEERARYFRLVGRS